MLKNYIPVLQVVMLSLLAFLLHKLCFYLFGWQARESGFYHSLVFLYVFFLACSVTILLILIKIKQKNLDHVGYTFLLLTTVKMAIAYLILRPVLQSGSVDIAFEKANFFFIFAVFLTLETTFTIRMINKQ